LAGKKLTKAEKEKRAEIRKKQAERIQKAESIRSEAIVIVLFALSVLLFLSNFKLCGIVGNFFRTLQLGLFGVIGYFFPILLFLCCVFGISNRDNPAVAWKIPPVILAVISLSGIVHLFFGKPYEDTGSFLEFYRSGSAGGLLGGAFASACRAVIGKVGAFIVLAVTFIISMVCITEKSFVNAVKKEGERAYHRTKEGMEKHRGSLKKQAEENGRGIDLDATDLSGEISKTAAENGAAGEDKTDHASVYDFETQKENRENDFSTPEEAVPSSGSALSLFDDDSVPFDTGEGSSLDLACKKADEILQNAKDGSSDPDEPEKDIYPDPNTDAYVQGILDTEGGVRTIVTSTGKVIQSEQDPEVVQRKMAEARRKTETGEIRAGIRVKEINKKPYVFPPLNLLERPKKSEHPVSDKEYRDTAVKLQQTLQNFGVGVNVTNISCGPVVTRYEIHPEQGVKVSRIVALADDIKLSLAASDIRIEAPIPGKSAVGIEVPNRENNLVYLREILESEDFKNNRYKIAFALGKDIGGQIVITDISKMPHLLIAGATGSGKSVCINTLIVSVLYKYKPEEVKLLMIDPKVVELSVYNGIPHLLIPVVTDPKKAAGALNWAVSEMTDRYRKFASAGVRDLKGYNDRIEASLQSGTVTREEMPEKMPQVLIVIDELADLMMVAQSEVEDAICRLAQLARAAGIHLVIATQRPSVNVITGLIKANIPSRIAFAVTSGVDSRTILDGIGAEKLLGKGDMLFSPQGAPKPMRIQGAFISDREVQKVVDYIVKQGFTPAYDQATVDKISSTQGEFPGTKGDDSGNFDELFGQAGRFIIEKDKASIGNLQRMFKIGFNRAARIMDQLCEAGVVGEEQGTKPREILMDTDQFEELLKNIRI